MNEAKTFMNRYKNEVNDINFIMTALDQSDAISEQNYETETTFWFFHDGSYIEINNLSICIGEN